MRTLVAAAILAMTATSAFGQMMMRPADAPAVTAAGQSWFREREPIQVSGEMYHRAGAAVYFNGNVMVPIGHYNGVPVYADATLDPYSIIFIPAGGRLMQPYERLRRGDLAGSVGSRPPSFPTDVVPDRTAALAAATAPTNLPVPLGAIAAFTPDGQPLSLVSVAGRVTLSTAVAQAPTCACDTPVQTAVSVAPFRFEGTAVISARRPDNNDGLWVWYANAAWVNRGKAEPRSAAFTQVGDRDGMPVFRKTGAGDEIIYLPANGGYLAPYHRRG